ncbi:hypothetical protein FIU97_13940 [Roseivivax sp. THAF40]|uniref:hypothetical protein n=1 Tax=unclassified Roseivivax TaxID=2639302 RepID=UPI001267D93D|nr:MULTISPECIES: hypothetical protein [unclassified Roseivivax]QFS83845.1 hypothetical protein FIV09_13500 [Roseivivax sp. THAF197b]QFT47677.1 hypothetical protein FIU97_13940 [Roseivivax sp. THAF40]
MKRTAFALSFAMIGTVSAVAAADLYEDAPEEVIEISVSAGELAECQETLAQVAARPARHDNGTPILFDWGQSDLPQVRCVVGEA